MQNNDKRSCICIMEYQKDKRQKVREYAIFGVIMAENFPKLITEMKPHIPESQKTPNVISSKTLCIGSL